MAIKSVPEDFEVTEELTPIFTGAISDRAGPHALFTVQKRSLTTHELLAALAKRMGVAVADIAAAGLKDKHAVATQHVTVRVDANRRLPPRSIEAPSFTARQLGFVPAAIDAQAIACNRFRLVVRGLTRRAVEQMQDAASRLMTTPEDLRSGRARLHYTNYFGNQRFGSARAGQGFVAAHLVRGEFERALQLAIAVPHRKDLHRVKQFKQAVADAWQSRDWNAALASLPAIPERAAIEHLAQRSDDFRGAFAALPYFFQQLCVEAYQSLLWNRTITALLIDRLGNSGRLWVVDDTFGQLVYPEAGALPPDLLDADVPMLSRRTTLAEPWYNAALAVLREEGIDIADLRIPGLDKPWFGESMRRIVATAEQFHMGTPQPDERAGDRGRSRVTMSFTLPRGAYATVLLRALGQ